MKRTLFAVALLTAPLATSAAQNTLLSGTGTMNFTSLALPGFSVGGGLVNWSFLLTTSPPPAYANPFINFTDVIGTFTQGSTTKSVTGTFTAFYIQANGGYQGGFAFESNFNPNPPFDLFDLVFSTNGPELLSGPTSAPTWKNGTFDLTKWSPPNYPPNNPRLTTNQVVISSVNVVPEPSTFALSAVGALGVLALARRRQRPTA